jgi:hypothetical protein
MLGQTYDAIEIASELERLRQEIQAITRITRLQVLAAEPARYANGDLVYANNTDWNPGSGEGVYAREAGAWVKL